MTRRRAPSYSGDRRSTATTEQPTDHMRNADLDDRGAVAGTDDAGARTDGSEQAFRPPLERIGALDGVRTVAVYLVVAFHAGLASFEGGFIGVDVFFVLSGFLITRLLLDEFERRGRVDLPRFYARRARRLLPAAWVAIVATSVMFVGVATPFEREAVVGDARSALLYVANWNFVREGQDYFAESLESSPFLHLWSLSVEEQFYLVWPLVALGVFRLWRRSRRLAMTLVALGTVLGALWAIRLAGDDVVRAYYGTDTRAYQLLAGALIAFGFASGVGRRGRGDRDGGGAGNRAGSAAACIVPDVVGALALVAVVLLATSFSLDPVERGVAAAVATSALIIALAWPRGAPGGRSGPTHDAPHPVRRRRFTPERLLASRPMTALGDLSYATYLWHWPIVIVFGRVFDVGPRTMFVVVALSATGLAKLSMDLVERPVRRRGARSDRRRDLLTSAVAITVTVVLAVVAVPAILRSDVAMLRAADRPGFASADASAAPPTAPVGNAAGAPAEAPVTDSDVSGPPDSETGATSSVAPSDGTASDSAATPGEPTVTVPSPGEPPPSTAAVADDAASADAAPVATLPMPFGPEPTEPIPVPDDLGQPPIETEFGEKTGCVNEVPTSVDDCTTVTGPGTRLLLLGDSHASKLNVAFTTYGAANGFTVATVSGNGCPWQDGLLYRDALPVEAAKQFCRDQRDAVYDWFAEDFAPDVVVIANHDQTTENYDVVPRPERGTDDTLAGLELVTAMSGQSFDRLAEVSARVVLLEPLPNSPFHPINCLSAAEFVDDCAFGLGAWPHVETPTLRELAAARPTVSTLDMTPFACPHFPLCRPIVDGVAVREDPDHLDVRHTLRIVDTLMSRLAL